MPSATPVPCPGRLLGRGRRPADLSPPPRSRARYSAVSAPPPPSSRRSCVTCSRPRRKPRTGPFRRPRLGRRRLRRTDPRRDAAGEQEPDERRDGRRPRRWPDRSRAKLVRERPGGDHPDSEHDVVGAHEQRRRTAARLVGHRAALDEQRVAHDRGSVAGAGHRHGDCGDPDVRRGHAAPTIPTATSPIEVMNGRERPVLQL